MTKRLALFATLLFIALHWPHLATPPGGFHEWRESDTATVAVGFLRNGFDFWSPEINLFGPGDTTLVGTELPVYNYVVAIAYQVLGYSHVWPRMLSVLSALLLAISTGALAQRLEPKQPGLKPLVFWLTLFNPLVFFYGGRIQPDVLGLALTTTAANLFFGATTTIRLIAACVCLAVAGGIKPTFFFVGLPLAAMLAGEPGGLVRALRRPRLWLFASCALLPAALWFAYARDLTTRYGSPYFYLGQGWTESLQHLGNPKFYKHVFLIWPLELAVGIPLVPWFFYGLFRFKALDSRRIVLAWVLGSLVVFGLAAGHCATMHDYYFLPILPALTIVVAHGIHSQPNRRLVGLALVVVALGPIASYFRIKHRYADDQEFWILQKSGIPADARVVAIDPMPGFQLYRVGRRGYHAHPTETLQAVATAWLRGARYLVHSQRNGQLHETTKAHLDVPPVLTTGQTTIFRIRESVLSAPLEQPLLNRP